MAFDAYKILDELETGSLIDLIAPCMDDYLYIIDLKNDTLRTSQSAVERFMLSDKFMNDAIKHLRTLVYEKDRKLFRKIIEMVHTINIKICIEGIEKEEWACAMKEIHVDYMQGYLYGRPCEKGAFLNNYVNINI